MENNNYKKNIQLGQSYGSAVHQLRKMVLFKLVQETKQDICYQCNKQIETIDNFSIEHKDPWLDSTNPKKSFFDLNNIAFSHTNCNISAARKPNKIVSLDGNGWCWCCKQYKVLDEFPPSVKRTGKNKICTSCATERRLERRRITGRR
jgi:hypothetical protein